MSDVSDVLELCAAARSAAPTLARASTRAKDAALEGIAVALEASGDALRDAGAEDVARARQRGCSTEEAERLALTGERVERMASAVRTVAALPDPVGEVLGGGILPSGLDAHRVRVPLGVLAVAHDGPAEVTIDAAALALKSGNASVLRGSGSALAASRALAGILPRVLVDLGLPSGALGLVLDSGHGALAELAGARGLVDLLLSRGDPEFTTEVAEAASVPVLEMGRGNCHVYVDAGADPRRAARIVVDAKVADPSDPAAVDTLLVHRDVAEVFLPVVAPTLTAAGVELRGDTTAQAIVEMSGAQPQDWDREYRGLTLAVRVVDALSDAVAHIAAHGSSLAEAIVTADLASARRFAAEVDAGVVVVNASTRFATGPDLGMGPDLGVSTQRIHARGPVTLRDLTTTKHTIMGEGQVRG